VEQEFQDNPHVQVFKLAVSNEKGLQEFHRYGPSKEQAEMSSLFRRPKVEQRLQLSITTFHVATISLDDFINEQGLTKVHFAKIDTEGGEWNVLQGAENSLANHIIDILQFEYGGTWEDANITLQQAWNFLRDKGYEIYRVLPQGLLHIPSWNDNLETYRYSNWLAISPTGGKQRLFGKQMSTTTVVEHPQTSSLASDEIATIRNIASKRSPDALIDQAKIFQAENNIAAARRCTIVALALQPNSTVAQTLWQSLS
jgi:FkbM family methyltransferase